MARWPKHATWQGPIVMIGFGSIGRGILPLVLRHIDCDPSHITIIDPSDESQALAEVQGVTHFIKQGLSPQNYKKILKPLLNDEAHASLIINLSVDVSSIDIIQFAHDTGSLYIDTVNEPWPGFYFNEKAGSAARTNYTIREELLKVKRKLGTGPTAVTCCGANPGMVSWFVKQALLDIANDVGLKFAEPRSRLEWANLAKRLNVKGIHVSDRDTQVSKRRKQPDEFLNTWSAEGFISEGLQPAELGWGSHEKKLPDGGMRHRKGSKAAIYIERPGADTRVRSWVPGVGAQFAYLVTHNEAISLADYFTISKGGKTVYRPTSHYAYHPCDDAVLSVQEMFARGGKPQSTLHVLREDEITEGTDQLGVLLYGHKKNAYWYGSTLSIGEARKLAPYQNATGLQVTSAVLAGLIWAIENPMAGIVETEEMDFRRCLEIQTPYLGEVTGIYTDWNPLKDRLMLFKEPLDKRDPWQFTNIIVR